MGAVGDVVGVGGGVAQGVDGRDHVAVVIVGGDIVGDGESGGGENIGDDPAQAIKIVGGGDVGLGSEAHERYPRTRSVDITITKNSNICDRIFDVLSLPSSSNESPCESIFGVFGVCAYEKR